MPYIPGKLLDGQYMMGPIKLDKFDERDYTYIPKRKSRPVKCINISRCSSIKHQGQEGACVGFGGCATYELMVNIKGTQLAFTNDMSERWCYEMAKLHDEYEGEDYEGSSVKGGIKGMHKKGLCHEYFWPYIAQEPGEQKSGAERQAALNKIQAYYKVYYRWELYTESGHIIDPETAMTIPLSDEELNLVKQAIYEFGGLYVSCFTHEGWGKIQPNGLISFDPYSENLGGHAFCLVGYDDQEQVFWLKNSWGSDWAKNGFAAISYKDVAKNLKNAWGIVL